MIKLSFFILCCWLSTLALGQPDLKKGLVAYYPFNGTAKDESTGKNNPVVAKISYGADKNGSKNKAAIFNGKNNYIQIPNHSSLNFADSFTICAWVKVQDFYAGPCHGNRILMKGDEDYQQGNYFLTFDDNAYTNSRNCIIEKPDSAHQLFYGPVNGKVSYLKKQYVRKNKWNFLCFIVKGETASLYVNGVLTLEGENDASSFDNADDLFIGKMNHYKFPYWFNGALDELRLYNRAISAREMNLLYKKVK